MKHIKRFSVVLVIPGLIAVLIGVWIILTLPSGCGYVVDAPAFSAAAPVQRTLDKLRECLHIPWAADLRCQGMTVASERAGSMQATMYAVSEGFFDVAHETLEEGRLLNGGDINAHTWAAMISRKGAETLFPGISALGQTVRAGEKSLVIVGVVTGDMRIGEAQEMLLFVPISLADGDWIDPQTMEIRISSSDAEEKAQFSAEMRQMWPEGTLQDHARLRLAALMPLWLLGCVLGTAVLIRLAGILVKAAAFLLRRTRDELENRYMSSMALQLAARGATVLLMLGCWAAAAWLLLRLVALPMFTFTDWIPESPADPSAIIATVKNLLSVGAKSAVYHSQVSAAAETGAVMIRSGSMVCLCAFLLFRTGGQERKEKPERRGFVKTKEIME